MADLSISEMMTQAAPNYEQPTTGNKDPHCQEEVQGSGGVSDPAKSLASPVHCSEAVADLSISEMMTQAAPNYEQPTTENKDPHCQEEPQGSIDVSDLVKSQALSVHCSETVADLSISEMMTQAAPNYEQPTTGNKDPHCQEEAQGSGAVSDLAKSLASPVHCSEAVADLSISEMMTQAAPNYEQPTTGNKDPHCQEEAQGSIDISDLAKSQSLPVHCSEAVADLSISDMMTQVAPDYEKPATRHRDSHCQKEAQCSEGLHSGALDDLSISDMMTQAAGLKQSPDRVVGELGCRKKPADKNMHEMMTQDVHIETSSDGVLTSDAAIDDTAARDQHAMNESPKDCEQVHPANNGSPDLTTEPKRAERRHSDLLHNKKSLEPCSTKMEVSSCHNKVGTLRKSIHAIAGASGHNIFEAETQPLADDVDPRQLGNNASDEICDMMTQVAEGNNKIFLEESDSQAIHAEIEKFEARVVDEALREISFAIGRRTPSKRRKSGDEKKSHVKGEISSLPYSTAPIQEEVCNSADSHDSVEDRIRAMNDKNISTQVLPSQVLHKKTTVAELLETLEGSQGVLVSQRKLNKPIEGSDSETSNYLESQGVGRRVRRRAVKLLSSDEEEPLEKNEDEKTVVETSPLGLRGSKSVTDESKLKVVKKYCRKKKVVQDKSKTDEENDEESFHLNVSEDQVATSRSDGVNTPPTNTKSGVKLQTTPKATPSEAACETPEIPSNFFGTPLNFQKPPVLRQYVNRKKLSLNISAEVPNASSTPMMEAVPRNVKRFKKASPTKRSVQVELFSQDSETVSSQDENDSIDLGRGKRKRVKKTFFGFDDEGNARTSHPSDGRVSNSPPETEGARIERPRKQAFMETKPHAVSQISPASARLESGTERDESENSMEVVTTRNHEIQKLTNSQEIGKQAESKNEARHGGISPKDGKLLEKKCEIPAPDTDVASPDCRLSKNGIELKKKRGRPARKTNGQTANVEAADKDDSQATSSHSTSNLIKECGGEATSGVSSVTTQMRGPPKKRGRLLQNVSSQDVPQKVERRPSVVDSEVASVGLKNSLPSTEKPPKKRGRLPKNSNSQETLVKVVKSPDNESKPIDFPPDVATTSSGNATERLPTRGRRSQNVSSQENGSSRIPGAEGMSTSTFQEASSSKVGSPESTATVSAETMEVKLPVKRRGRPRKTTDHLNVVTSECTNETKADKTDGVIPPECTSDLTDVSARLNQPIKKRGRPRRNVISLEASGAETPTEERSSKKGEPEKSTEAQAVIIEPPKKRGRPARNAIVSVEEETRGQNLVSMSVAKNGGECSTSSHTDDRTVTDYSRRSRKPVDVSMESGAHDSQDSQGRRSGRARKKKESFDEIMARKEEEIRLKKQLRALESSPDKSESPSTLSRVSPTTPEPSTSSMRFAKGGPRNVTPSPGTSKRKIDDLEESSRGVTKVMFTGLADAKLSGIVKKLGGKVVVKPQDCNVLVTDQVRRTVKFLCALGLGTPIVSPNWLSKSKAFNAFADPEESLLVDPEAEAKFNFHLSSSLENARNSRLLEGCSFHATPSVLPTPKEIKPIVECSGGSYFTKPPAKWPSRSFVVSCPKDRPLWNKITKAGLGPDVISAEALLSGILQQRFDPDNYKLQ